MESKLSPSARRVQDVLTLAGLGSRVVELPGSTRTAQEAADAVGCSVGQIVKSLLFRGRESGRPLLVLASGSNRVNEKLLGRLVGEKIEKADPAFVRESTGFAIGGVSPVGHLRPLDTYIDEELRQYAEIWAAAGTPHAVFRLTPAELLQLTAGKVVAIS